MVAFNYCNDVFEDVGKQVHDFNTHTFRLALSNTAPALETSDPTADGNGQLANVTQISYTNVSGGAAPTLDNVAEAFSAGIYSVDADNETILASGGAVGPFRYVYLYNDSVVGDPLLGYWDYGSALTLNDGESLVVSLTTVLLRVKAPV